MCWKEYCTGTLWPFHTLLSKRRKHPQHAIMMTTLNQKTEANLNHIHKKTEQHLDYIFMCPSSVLIWKKQQKTDSPRQLEAGQIKQTMWSIWMMMWLATSQNSHTSQITEWGLILQLYVQFFHLSIFKKYHEAWEKERTVNGLKWMHVGPCYRLCVFWSRKILNQLWSTLNSMVSNKAQNEATFIIGTQNLHHIMFFLIVCLFGLFNLSFSSQSDNGYFFLFFSSVQFMNKSATQPSCMHIQHWQGSPSSSLRFYSAWQQRLILQEMSVCCCVKITVLFKRRNLKHG